MAETVRSPLEAMMKLANDMPFLDMLKMKEHLHAALSALPGPRKLEWEWRGSGFGFPWVSTCGNYFISGADRNGVFTAKMNAESPVCVEPSTGDYCSLKDAQAACQSHADASADPLATLRAKLKGRAQEWMTIAVACHHTTNDDFNRGRGSAWSAASSELSALIDALGGAT